MDFITIGKSEQQAVSLNMKMLNRHGLIAGATGTGKTVTIKVLAEQLSDAGVPVFVSDIKGDIASLAEKGEMNDKLEERIRMLGIEDFDFKGYPVECWDLFGENGLPVRASVSEMGPLMISRLLGLNEVQSGIINIAFRVADEQGLMLLDLKDLRAMLNEIAERRMELAKEFGNISTASVGAIVRGLLVLEQQGADVFIGEPSLDILDLLKKKEDGSGPINILSSEKLFHSPKLYSTFLFWMLTELYENLEEVGDLDKPKLVFFFDEAHLLFDSSSSALLEKIELVARLIRSKGVGIFFATQNPMDIPDSVSSQLGNRIQHSLRAFTPKEQKVVKAVAQTFRQREGENIEKMILELGVGEALVSTLDEKGSPSFVERTLVYPPRSKFGTLDPSVRLSLINNSPFLTKYEEAVDRESAYEMLQSSYEKKKQKEAEELQRLEKEKRQKQEEKTSSSRQTTTTRRTDSNFDRFTKNMMSEVGRGIGRIISRGIFGNLK